MYTPRLHPELARSGEEIQVPLPRLRLQDLRRQLRRPRALPLERYAIRRTEEGEIVVDKSRKFQRELGQWDDPESYVLV